ncbi:MULTISPECIES: sodium-extruding oxaloacetate decarboxylase subunit alpha [Dehalococcoides]|uniref:Oxaloacetate decarboxylase, alpha subunit n=1 Tax=Dehalococcoides mccartyi (strain CBDB1) TaxID=255470 RepID=A0A916P3C2_DEHMC|nr:sodium-extruding oxaloacetate decarboxylase subunit alpha [Dehalococcoides mccartyi]PKH45398.1 oxaloacetate decarboxylase subunit alpha [Dehalococcoides mccartyi]BAS31261.1 pyruvate carboxylase subunit B [Dehalococcoides mccartyi IBARAKI]BEL00247.1 sodium-extruding oxaloacetate decarboxylase subunit alpha [Dehalococcoides mccartyi]CAI82395.1 oxaloacetate decarboxylase, alpha subunit [Dehalococcoides mccartyi CBDB1]
MGIKITDTTLRDAHQSLIATRMRTRDMIDIAARLDKAGFHSLEVWGGATFDSCIRFLNEDPWERLRLIRQKAPNTPLQMLLRGQNLVGYRHYADDVVREFVRLSVKNGIDIFRVFDALNDIRNMEVSIQTAKELKAHVQGTICYTTSPIHTVEKLAEMAVELEKMGCDSICIKDMAGLITPTAAAQLVKSIKAKVKLPVDLHSHCTSGMAPLAYYAAAEAGVDIIDTAFSAFAWGTSQPTTESFVAAFKGTKLDTGLDLELMSEIGEEFNKISASYRCLYTCEATQPSISVLLHQIPGGMISNLVSQLRQQNAFDKLSEVLAEVPRVRADLGYPPLVTPSSQIVGTQAILNVLSGERYKQVTKETKNYLMGYYGKIPGKVNEDIRKAIIGDEKPISVRPGALLEPELPKMKAEGEKLGILKTEEDLLTYAMYPEVAAKFLKGECKEECLLPSTPEAAKPVKTEAKPVPAFSGSAEYSVEVDGEVFTVKVSAKAGVAGEAPKALKPTASHPGAIVSPMQGMLLSLKVKEGDKVTEGEVVATIEAMKMENDVCATVNGVVVEIYAYEGEVVGSKDVIMVIEPDA